MKAYVRMFRFVMAGIIGGVVIQASSVQAVVATGGSETNDYLDYRLHIFTGVGGHTFEVSDGGLVDVLVVGGGGGGGGDLSASGGGGGVVFTNMTVTNGQMAAVSVGAGGVGSATQNQGQSGGTSVFGSLTAYGGGGRGVNDGHGASGSGSSGRLNNEGAAIDYAPYQGHDGGVRTGNYGGGGGGGAGSVGGGSGTAAAIGGNGGDGLDYSSIVGTGLGDQGWFGGGGGGCSYTYGTDSVGSGGPGGGGTGGSRDVTAEHGASNTGGGGGGGGHGSPTHIGGDGGSGVVIIRYVRADAPLSVEAHSPTGIGKTNATLHGKTLGFGEAESPRIYVCWGDTDPQTDQTSAWANVIFMGDNWMMGEPFDHPLTDLDYSMPHYFRVYATNSTGEAWSDTVEVQLLRDLYVSTNATVSGSPWNSWSTAFTNVQDALNEAVSGETIYLAGHVFEGGPLGATHPSNSVFLLQDLTHITIRGGYEAAAGSGANPGANDPDQWPTVLRRQAAAGAARVLAMRGVESVRFMDISLQGGNGVDNGGGVCLTDCADIVFDACRFTANQGVTGTGGGISLFSSSALITNSIIASNSVIADGDRRGGGVYVSPGSEAQIVHSSILNNNAHGADRWGNNDAYGGGIFIEAGGILTIRESVVAGNSSTSGSYANTFGGGVDNRGILRMFNSLVVSNWVERGSTIDTTAEFGDGIYSAGDTVIVNCTIADNNSATRTQFGIHYAGGAIAISNSIIWGHASADLWGFSPDGEGRFPDVWYSNYGGGENDGFQGCSSQNPLFADRVHYHLQSASGHYTNGYFSGGEWTVSTGNSPLIDRGSPASDWSREPDPNGERLNLGAFGGTEVAAKTTPPPDDPPIVDNSGALKWGYRTAVLHGEVIEDYGESPDTWFRYWRESDPSITNSIYGGTRLGLFSATLSDLTPDETYAYVAVASNRAGETVTDATVFVTRPPDKPLYVATTGDNTAGTNWATAYHEPHTAWSIAETGNTILFAGDTFEGEPDLLYGKYYAFLWENATNVSLRGGWRASVANGDDDNLPGARDSDQWPTVLQRRDDSGNGRVLTMIGISNAVIEQVTFRNGTGVTDGGGVYLTGCRDVIFDTCRIIENQGVGCDGGGMHLVDGTVIVTNSLIADNSVTVVGDRRGGGIYVGSGGDLQVIHSTIRDNNAYGGGRWGAAAAYGGGFFVEAGGTLNIRESILTGNSSTSSSDANTYGGAIDNRGVLQMVNSRVVSNWAERGSVQVSTDEHGDGLYSVGDAAIVNCTIADNNVATRNQFGIHYSGGTLAITNSIIWGHATADLTNLPVNVEGTFDGFFHNLYGTAMTGGVEIDMDGIAGCIIGDPLFEGDGEHSYRLQRAISPAIDAGINLPWMHGASDVAGYARIMYGGRSFTVDMGAYETFPVPGSMIRFR